MLPVVWVITNLKKNKKIKLKKYSEVENNVYPPDESCADFSP